MNVLVLDHNKRVASLRVNPETGALYATADPLDETEIPEGALIGNLGRVIRLAPSGRAIIESEGGGGGGAGSVLGFSSDMTELGNDIGDGNAGYDVTNVGSVTFDEDGATFGAGNGGLTMRQPFAGWNATADFELAFTMDYATQTVVAPCVFCTYNTNDALSGGVSIFVTHPTGSKVNGIQIYKAGVSQVVTANNIFVAGNTYDVRITRTASDMKWRVYVDEVLVATQAGTDSAPIMMDLGTGTWTCSVGTARNDNAATKFIGTLRDLSWTNPLYVAEA